MFTQFFFWERKRVYTVNINVVQVFFKYLFCNFDQSTWFLFSFNLYVILKTNFYHLLWTIYTWKFTINWFIDFKLHFVLALPGLFLSNFFFWNFCSEYVWLNHGSAYFFFYLFELILFIFYIFYFFILFFYLFLMGPQERDKSLWNLCFKNTNSGFFNVNEFSNKSLFFNRQNCCYYYVFTFII